MPVAVHANVRLVAIEEVEGGAVFVLAEDQALTPTHKIFLPWDAIPDALEMTTNFLARRARTVAGGVYLHVVGH